MELFQIDDDGLLFISPDIDDWAAVAKYGIDVVIDLEGAVDVDIPSTPNYCLYVYLPIDDDNEQLPNLKRMRAVATLAASLMRDGHRVLSHCGMGLNRSALMAGLILIELGTPGPAAVGRIRERRPGALYNECFAGCLESITGTKTADVALET
jgi:protein-tyrosine phosphatase